MQIGSPSKRQELGCGTESRSIPAQSKPTTDSAIACSKNYKAKGSILCASIFDQGRVKRLSPSIYLFVCVWMCVSSKNTACLIVQKIMFTSNLRGIGASACSKQRSCEAILSTQLNCLEMSKEELDMLTL